MDEMLKESLSDLHKFAYEANHSQTQKSTLNQRYTTQQLVGGLYAANAALERLAQIVEQMKERIKQLEEA